MTRRSAWIITRDHLAEEYGDTETEVGTSGPSDAPVSLLTRLDGSKTFGHAFRMLDDDGVLYYSGRIAFLPRGNDAVTPWSAYESDAFGPLDDYGTPNAGAVDLQYRQAGRWVSI